METAPRRSDTPSRHRSQTAQTVDGFESDGHSHHSGGRRPETRGSGRLPIINFSYLKVWSSFLTVNLCVLLALVALKSSPLFSLLSLSLWSQSPTTASASSVVVLRTSSKLSVTPEAVF